MQLTIKEVRLHKEERKVQGAQYGSYSSNYVACFDEYPNGIAVVDAIASGRHPDWEKKTEQRANTLSQELAGKLVTVRIKDVYNGENTFEGIIVNIEI